MEETNKNREKSTEEEIKELEVLLAEKKKTLEERGIEKEPKEVFREVFKEYVQTQKALPPAPSTGNSTVISDDQKKKADELRKKERQEQLEHLISLSFEKGLLDAVNMAETMTPWLLDELHDRLVDEYYDKLLQGNMLKEF